MMIDKVVKKVSKC